MRDTLIMKKPASYSADLLRDGIPLGNGKTGALVKGSLGLEEILFNRGDLWHTYKMGKLPDLGNALQEARAAIDRGDYATANDLMYNRLCEKGYHAVCGKPMIMGTLSLLHLKTQDFTNYRRILYMEKAECEVSCFYGEKEMRRRCFVSKDDDVFYYLHESEEETDVIISFDFFDDQTETTSYLRNKIGEGLKIQVNDNEILYTVCGAEMEYGVKISVFGTAVKAEGNGLRVCGKSFRLAVRCVSGTGSIAQIDALQDFDYEKKLRKHEALHKKLYQCADIQLYHGRWHSNEELLDRVYENHADIELIEKMWRYGRYLFVCGTCEGGLPYPLYGLWHTKYHAKWSQHVSNENVQMIYWHADVGGLSELVRPLIDYYTSAMELHRENAQKLFGCKGIFVSVYSTPVSRQLPVYVPVVLNYTVAAAWLSSHFYKYYRYTKDQKTLVEKILPFMVEAAEFYLDYIQYDENGKVLYYPSVSPENTPSNLQEPNPVTKNATMEIAIVKELLHNLSILIGETGKFRELLPKIETTLAAMPEYLINEDGALQEWITEDLKDNYAHRHYSQFYPFFPGEEIKKEDEKIYAAVKRAFELRGCELGAQCGWAHAHLACIHAAMGQGEEAMKRLDLLLKSCAQNNLFLTYSDYRNMGLTMPMASGVVQMDATMGVVNVVQMMILNERNGELSLLPALSKRMEKGKVKGLRFSLGTVDMLWDVQKGRFEVSLKFESDGEILVHLPSVFKKSKLRVGNETKQVDKKTIVLQAKRGETVSLIF